MLGHLFRFELGLLSSVCFIGNYNAIGTAREQFDLSFVLDSWLVGGRGLKLTWYGVELRSSWTKVSVVDYGSICHA